MEFLRISVGDTLELKKPHPCGKSSFRVARTGSDVRIVCLGCGRDVTVERLKLEKNIRSVISEVEDK